MTSPRILALIVLLTASVAAGQTPARTQDDKEAIWRQYFSWYQQGDPRSHTQERYRAKLIADGMSEAAAAERVALIEKLSAEHRLDFVALGFDRTYTDPVEHFNTKPNAFLVGVTSDLKPGTALDVAMGQGRNALYLARQGWKVTGFDISAQGLELARAAAAKAGVALTTVLSSYEQFDFGREQWDLIVFSYAWVPLSDPALIARVRAALRPGGLVVIEHPAEDPLKPVAQREWTPEPTDEVNTLAKAWVNGFRILRYDDTEDQCDWRNRKARILRLLARKW
jgi:2-polyprenyl-3-methyl-5-hydroxy-6-metoxy-1,4-benzoquinol methylase